MDRRARGERHACVVEKEKPVGRTGGGGCLFFLPSFLPSVGGGNALSQPAQVRRAADAEATMPSSATSATAARAMFDCNRRSTKGRDNDGSTGEGRERGGEGEGGGEE